MEKVAVYRFAIYDIRSDELVLSKRWGTREAIERVGGQVVETSCFETDEASILTNITGLTEIGFAPPTASIIWPPLKGAAGADPLVP